MPRTVAIIQARLGSQRMPEKVFCELDGRPMLEWVVRRVRRARLVDEIVIATTQESRDERLRKYCEQMGWPIWAGPENDVLTRYLQAAEAFAAERIVRVTSDCPLIDPGLIDQVIGKMDSAINLEYCCNFWPRRTFPRGLDVECLTHETLCRVDKLADSPELREHVTLGIYRNPQQFVIGSVANSEDYSELRWTVDTIDDARLIREILKVFHEDRFTWQDVISSYRAHPCWNQINSHVRQKVA